MNKILCSIIIPYYNVPAELVNKCLNSVFNQNWGDFQYEVIFINDGSPLPLDSSTKDFSHKFQHFTLIKQQNQGLSAARNSGIKIANGNYIFFIDPDDYWLNNKIKDLIPFMLQEEYDIIKFKTAHIYDSSQLQPFYKSSTKTTIFTSGSEYMATNNIIKGACTYCFRTHFIKKHNILMPEGLIHEDEWFLTLAFLKAQKCLFTKIPLYIYKKREGSIMSQKTVELREQSFNNFFKIIEMTKLLKEEDRLSYTQEKAINNRLSYMLYDYIYNIVTSNLSNDIKRYFITKLKLLKLFPLPNIGQSLQFKLLRLFSFNKICLNYFIKTIYAVNTRRVKGKCY